MQLNEIFEENTLESISQRTRIPPEILDQLRRCEIETFQKVQVLGFISILEREYRADLSTFRQECLAAFGAQPERSESSTPLSQYDDSPSHKPLIVEAAEGGREPRSYKGLGVLVLVALLLYAAWMTFSSMQQSTDANRTTGEDVGFFASVADQIRQQLGGGESNETVAQDTVPATAEMNTSSVLETTPVSEETTVQADAKSKSADNLEQIRRIDDQIARADVQGDASSGEKKPLKPEVPSMKQGEKPADQSRANRPDAAAQEAARRAEAERQIAMEAERKAAEEAARQEAEAARQAAAEKARLEEAARKKAVEEARLAEEAAARKKAEEEAARKAAEAAQKQAEEKVRKEAERKAAEAARKKAAEAAGGVMLRPHAKVWLGIVDLTTMKRRVVTTQSPIAFKNPDGRWLVATGHGRLGLKIGGRLLDFNDSKKHFLLIENGTVREISHERFQQLNKSKVW